MKRLARYLPLLAKVLSVLCISIIFNSCKDDPASPQEDAGSGSIFITVTTAYGQVMKDVLISTNPSLKTGYTDDLGTYSMLNVPVGTYEIAATKSDYGSGKDMINVEKGKVTKVNIQLKPGLFFSYSPIAKITSPVSQSRYTPGDTIYFKAAASDNETAPAELSVKWYSDQDGLLNSDKANSKGEIAFQTTKLSKNAHVIRLEVEDADKNITKDSVVIYNNNPSAVKLANLQKSYNSVFLSWNQTQETGFRSYKIYRSENSASEGQVVYEIFDAAQVSYQDKDINLGADYYYHIRMELADGRYSNSNVQYIKSGVAIDVATQVEKMVLDSKRNYLYAIDRVNNNLIFINLNTQKSEKTIYIGKSPTDLDIDATGDTLYVANYGSTEISVVDLNSQSKVKSIFVNSSPYQVECGVRGQIVYAEGDQWCRLILVNSDTGAQLSVAGGNYYFPDIEMSPNGKSLYAGESGISGGHVYRVDISGNNFVSADVTPGYGYGYPIRKLVLSGNGKYIFYSGYKLLASNLSSQQGNFPENIYGTNSTGTVAFGETRIFNAEQFSTKRAMPVSSRVMTTSSDDGRLYIYDNKSSKIYIYDLTGI